MIAVPGLILKARLGIPIFLSEQVRIAYSRFINLTEGKTIKEWHQLLKSCRSCPARKEARQVVLPEGPMDSKYVFIPRNPGRLEDLYGRPFYPEAPGGALFEKYLQALEQKREDVYLSEAMFCYTTDDRAPIAREIYTCSLWKILEMKNLPNARYWFLLGNDAIRQFFGYNTLSIMKTFGEVYQMQFEGRKHLVIGINHPGQILRQPWLRDKTFTFLSRVRSLIQADEEGKLKWLI